MDLRIAFCRIAPFAAMVSLIASVPAGAVSHADMGCSVCHVPHNAGDVVVPIWNPERMSTTLSDFYASDSMDAEVGPVDGASKLCLSCHDGSQVGPEHTITSLQSLHPVSFIYDAAVAAADGGLVDPSSLAPGVLDRNQKMQCTSCHDMHATAVGMNYLRWAYDGNDGQDAMLTNSAFCRQCHLQ